MTRSTLRGASALALALFLVTCAGFAASAFADVSSPSRWHVMAGALAGGDGSRAAPFDSLTRAEEASRRGDHIVVLPAPLSAGPLDGGIALKPRQRLIGAGPPVRRDPEGVHAPRIANTDGSRVEGDAVRLASGTTVRNLVISAAHRGAIYGRNVTGVEVAGNDVSGHNASCAPGFHIPPFNVPTMLGGVGVPISAGLHNGWAGIMVDADQGRRRVEIAGNRVHDADCGDGIDVRVSGTAELRASVARNRVEELRQGENLDSLLAIGLQTPDRGSLAATLDRNSQSGLGNDEDLGIGPTGADSEGVFVNPTGPSSMDVTVSRNTYTHTGGRSGFSANGLEFVSMGDGSRGSVTVRDSTFSGTPGDLIEQLALGTNADLSMTLKRVIATRSTGFTGTGHGDTVIIPGNNGDCLIGASGGAGNVVDLRVRQATLTDCANNGLTVGSDVANGSGPSERVTLDVADSEITGNRGGALRIGNITDLEHLSVKVERSDLSDNKGLTSTPANLTALELGETQTATIDLGGGPLGSAGGVCLDGGRLAAAVVGYDVYARDAWWGDPAGPAPGRALAVGGTLDPSRPLGAPPPWCAG